MLSERYPVLWVGQTAVISAPVEVDVTNADDLGSCLASAVASGARALIVDMTTTTFCDCAGVQTIVACRMKGAAAGISVRVAVRDPAVKHVFAMTGAARLIGIRDTVADALMRED